MVDLDYDVLDHEEQRHDRSYLGQYFTDLRVRHRLHLQRVLPQEQQHSYRVLQPELGAIVVRRELRLVSRVREKITVMRVVNQKSLVQLVARQLQVDGLLGAKSLHDQQGVGPLDALHLELLGIDHIKIDL